MTLAAIHREIHRMDPTLDKSDKAFRAATVLLAACYVGTSVRPLAAFCRLPITPVAIYAAALNTAGVFKNGKVYAEWDDPEHGGVAFWMDCCVALGFVERGTNRARHATTKISKV